ncbi:MAG: hypothetical protein OXL98_04515 [Acidimicrobiaceae bacterium]|nr:hypothetical protein [Acidimicrobiaceae bacterium]
MTNVDILCLANAWKKSPGRCIAGIDMDDGSWVRPVSDTKDGELTAGQCTMDAGRQVAPLDVVRVYLDSPAPRPHQPEDWLISGRQWRLQGRLDIREAKKILEEASELHDDGIFGTATDRVTLSQIDALPGRQIASSLTVVRATAPEFTWGRKRQQKRAVFGHAGVTYDLAMTFEDRPPVGESASKWFFTVSLGEPFGSSCYKLVAGAIEVPTK